MDAWGIGYRQLEPLNPRLVYVALSTHGQFGPRAEGSGPEYDLIDQALSGLAYITGEPGERRAGGRADPRRELDQRLRPGRVGRAWRRWPRFTGGRRPGAAR